MTMALQSLNTKMALKPCIWNALLPLSVIARYTVIGTKGQAEVSLHNRTILIRPRWSQETISYDIPEEAGGHGGADPHLVDSFINAVNGTETNTSTTAHGLLSTAIGEAAEISRREERTVFMKELLG